jgi:ribonucleotide reductase alpha subunit
MDNEIISTIEEPKSRIYMREYKRKKYIENGDEMKAKNKAYYYKYKFGLNSEEMKKYQNLLPLVAKIRKGLEELKEKNPDFLQDVLEMYI